MKVCIPVTEGGQVDPRWGRAARVALASVDQGSVTGWREVDVRWDELHDQDGEGMHHARVARFLRDEGVEAVVCNHMGGGMADMLGRMGLQVHLGAAGDARQALKAALG